MIARSRARGARAGRKIAPPEPAILVLIACGFSAGIHFALIPSHAGESAKLAAAFGVAGVALLASALAVFTRPRNTPTVVATSALLVALLGAYLLSRTAGLSGLGHGPEPFDAVGGLTKAVELVALVASVHLYFDNRSRPAPLLKKRSNA